MDTYSFLREVADSWFLLAMFLFFLGAVAWAFRPGTTKLYEKISEIPLRGDAETLGYSDQVRSNDLTSKESENDR